MNINLDDIIKSWFQNASEKEQVQYLKTLLSENKTCNQSDDPTRRISTIDLNPKPAPVQRYSFDLKPKPPKTKQNKKNRPPRLKPIVLGRSFKNLKEAAEYHDIPYHVAQYRKDKGWPVEEIFKEAYDRDKKTKVLRRNEDGTITAVSNS